MKAGADFFLQTFVGLEESDGGLDNFVVKATCEALFEKGAVSALWEAFLD